MTQVKELIAKILFMIAAAISVAAVVVICVFIFGNGVLAVAEIGVFDFLFGTTLETFKRNLGIGTMIVGSLYVMAGCTRYWSSLRNSLCHILGEFWKQ